MSDMFYIGQKDYIPKLNQMADNAQSLAAASAASAATAEAKAAEAAGYAASASQYYSSIKQTGGRIHIGGADNGSSLLQVYGDTVATGNVSLGGAPGAESLRADKATGAVNYSAFSGAAAGQLPMFSMRGADNNVGLNLQPKGRGNIGISWGQPPARLSVAAQNIVSPAVAVIASVNTSTDTITTSAPHNFSNGDCVFYRTTQNGINAGGTVATDRWFFVNAPTSTTLTLHNTLNDALGGVSKLDITAAGTGVETLAGASLMISASNSQGNQNNIDMLSYRHTAGSDWTGIGTRLQVRTDNTSQGYLEFNPPGNNYGAKLGTANSGVLQFATGGGTQMVVANIGGTVNYARVRGGTAGNGVIYEAEGADAAIATNIGSKGAEHINFYTNSYVAGTGVRQARITHTANASNYVELTGGANGNPVSIASQGMNDADVQINYVTKGGGAHLFRTGGGAQLAVTNVNSAVNYWNMRGAASGGGLIAEAVGSDAAVPIAFYAKGAGNIDFHTGGGAGGERQFLVSHTAGAATYLNVTGNTAGNYPRLSGTGEAHTGIDFSANGSGNFWFRSNGGTATQLCIQGSASATANWAQVAGGAANIPPSLAARGEPNVGLSLNANGSGSIFLTTGGNAFTSQVRVQNYTGAVNYLTLTGGAGSSGGTIAVDGTGSGNLDLNLAAKGSGVISSASVIQSSGRVRLIEGSGVAGGASNQGQVGWQSVAGLQLIGSGTTSDVTIYDRNGNDRIQVRSGGVYIANAPLIAADDITNTRADGSLRFTGTTYGQVQAVVSDLYMTAAATGKKVVIQAAGVQHNFTSAGASIAGTTTSSGTVIVETNDALRMKPASGSAGYGVIARNDNVNFHLLVTNQNDANGTWNGLRPFYISLASGDVAMNHNLAVSGSATVGSLTSTGNITCNGLAMTSRHYVLAGNATTGQGGQFRSMDDSGVVRWTAGISGVGGDKDYFLYDTPNNRRIFVAGYATGNVSFGAAPGSAGEQFRVVRAGDTTVNFLSVTGATAGNAPVLAAMGASASIPIIYQSAGDVHSFRTGAGAEQFRIGHVASATNYLQVTGSTGANAVAIAAAGTGADLDITIAPKGGGALHSPSVITSAVQFRRVAASSSAGYLVNQQDTGANGNGVYWTGAGAQLQLVTAAVPAISISNTQRISIGTTNDDGINRLQVTGSTALTGSLTVNGQERNTSKTRITTGGLTAYTVGTRRTYFTGTAGVSFALTLPAAASEIDGQIHTVMSTTARPSTTWISTGATFVGAPSALEANTPVSLQYHHATTEWLAC